VINDESVSVFKNSCYDKKKRYSYLQKKHKSIAILNITICSV
jgi:hypothetical protein